MAGIEVRFAVDPIDGAVDGVQKFINDLCEAMVVPAYAETNSTGYYICWGGFDTEFECILLGKLLMPIEGVLSTSVCLGV